MKFKLDFSIAERRILSDWSKVCLLGSCFAHDQAKRFKSLGFGVLENPFGIIYNPASMAVILQRIKSDNLYVESDFSQVDDYFFSWEHHGSLRFDSIKEALDHSNLLLQKLKAFIQESHLVVLTFGTSIVHLLQEDGRVVANNRKLPASTFVKKQLSTQECVLYFNQICESVQSLNPNIEILSTISPIRHINSGLQANFLSKSVLRAALEQSALGDCYFPSYEIFMDELRDYRFSKEDMVHPTEAASEYIWERFLDSCCTPKFRKSLEQIKSFRKLEAHRPLHDANEHKAKLNKVKSELLRQYPNLTI